MREYKMRRGEELADRVPNMRETVEEYFGSITGTEEYNGSELFVVEEPDNPVFDRIVVGAVSYSNKKDTLAVDFTERPAKELIESGNVEAAEGAVTAKNDFLLKATGRDAKSRRESLKRAVENDPDVPEA